MNKYGLVGKKLGYSHSKLIYEYLFKMYNIEATYDLIELPEFNEEVLTLYDGLNVTTPYKEVATKCVENMSDISVCNTFANGKCINTDELGFKYLLESFSNPKRVVVLGVGGAAKMIRDALYQEVVLVDMLNDKDYEAQLYGDLLVNATPIGVSEYISPVKVRVLKKFKGVIDLNYNPLNSQLKLDCLALKIPYKSGLEMLVVQAIKSFEYFTKQPVDMAIVNQIIFHIFMQTNTKLAIIGMPLAGKTTLVNKYGGKDLDEEIERLYGKIDKLIVDEANFRKLEKDVLASLTNERLISLGGGAIQDLENIFNLKDYAFVFLNTDVNILKKRLSFNHRPLLKSMAHLIETYHHRIDLYKNIANLTLSYDELDALFALYTKKGTQS